jgi:hypothetical protein
MKKALLLLMLMAVGILPFQAKAQTDEVAQLVLNIEKLSQLKSILSDLKKGYTIVSNGYGTIKNISEGNFNLHQVFLDGLLEVSPGVKNYYRIADIINYQVRIVKDCRSTFNRLQSANLFSAKEISYCSGVYERLINQSLRNLDELMNVVTAKKLRMSDDERIKEIDRIYAEMEDKATFLNSFNSSANSLAIQRQKQLKEINAVRNITGIK